MKDMENKLDILTKKLYDEGVNKAKHEAEKLLENARQEADKIRTDAQQTALNIEAKALEVAEGVKKKMEAELILSARQTITALKQEITALVSGKVAKETAKAGFEDKAFVQELLMTIVKKWDPTAGNINLEILLPATEKEKFEGFVIHKYKDLLDKGLEIKIGPLKDAFVLQPHDGSYKITFSDELFESFFNLYIKDLTKSILYRHE
ncbi:hypothetical protein FACS1894199_10300 [Bacteroidia bacterium]|nr:hypothetical protein FACS1894199_10300 [Bacteroidia bacterium]